MQSVDIVVIGAGVVGAAIARDLVAAGFQTAVVDRAAGPASAVSCTAAGILASGFDRDPDSLEVQLLRESAERRTQVFSECGIAWRTVGAIALGRSAEDVDHFAAVVANARRSGIEIVPLDGAALRRLEPGTAARAGLLVPEEAITDPFEVTRRLLARVPVYYNAPVVAVEQRVAQAALVRLESAAIAARVVVNAAGLHADDIAADGTFTIEPVRGDFVVYARAEPAPLAHILRPARRGGVLVFPTLYANICAGPDAVPQGDKDDWRPRGLREVRAQAATMLPLLSAIAPVDAWAGLRTGATPREFIVEWSPRVPSMLNVAAIRGTGLSVALGISAYVLRLLGDRDIAPRGRQLAVQTAVYDATQPWWERHNRARGFTM